MRRPIVAAVLLLVIAGPVYPFPPYRSTDADTADPWMLETRLGLLRLRRDDGSNLYSSPLLRLNLGVPGGLEVITQPAACTRPG